MSLSDACAEFHIGLKKAAAELAREARRYAAPEYPIQHGPEADALGRLGEHVAASHWPEPEAVGLLLRLGQLVLEINSRPDVVNDRELRLMLNALADSILSHPGNGGEGGA